MSDLQVKAEFMVCEHGSLARVCLICELQRENADLLARLRRINEIASRGRLSTLDSEIILNLTAYDAAIAHGKEKP